MARQGEEDAGSGGEARGDLEEVVRESVTDARREIFSAYVRAREAGVVLAQDGAPPAQPDDEP
jgi:hypothetical protein